MLLFFLAIIMLLHEASQSNMIDCKMLEFKAFTKVQTKYVGHLNTVHTVHDAKFNLPNQLFVHSA
jgi:hypothetical protein